MAPLALGQVKAVICLAAASPYKMTHRFLKGTRTWESWFYRKSPNVKFDHDLQAKSVIRLAHWLHVEGVEFKPISWFDAYYDTRTCCRYLLKLAGYYCKPSLPKGKAVVPKRTTPRIRDTARALAHVPRPKPPSRGLRKLKEPPQVYSPKDYETTPDCKKCGPTFRLEDESKFRLPIEESVRLARIHAQPTMYYKIHCAATSGFYTGPELKELFPSASPHEMDMSDAFWFACHPPFCDCYFGEGGLVKSDEGLRMFREAVTSSEDARRRTQYVLGNLGYYHSRSRNTP